MEQIQFFMSMIPPTVTAQMHRVTIVKGKPNFYDSPELKDTRAKLTAHLARHAPPEPFATGIQLVAKWLFPLSGKHQDGEYRTSRPDTDNLQKLLKDCMTACGFWKDDALVCSEIAEKFWAKTPGIFIAITEVNHFDANAAPY
jgi:Holliday junction resolvase RusA-like endonuclease